MTEGITALKQELFKQIFQEPSPDRSGRRVQVALPLKVTCWDGDYKPCPDMACTYDISPQGARITGLRRVKQIGDIIAIERGRSKSFCRVVWVGDPNSEFRGQVGIQTVEADRLMWEAELRDLQEVYDPVVRESSLRNLRFGAECNHRRSPRYIIEGAAEVRSKTMQGKAASATLRDLSEVGCLLTTTQHFQAGAELHLTLNVADYELRLKALVRHIDPIGGLGLEFREIRKGDRQILRFLLRKLAEQELEQSFEFELQSKV
ncbi:MAG: hypothetical protein JWO91_3912 [Acidobacteriaceae bacterium]|nr:hypothetical protein [Acidobacteriaceae bacterium]